MGFLPSGSVKLLVFSLPDFSPQRTFPLSSTTSAMWVCWLLSVLALFSGVQSQGLGFGGLPGQRTPRTGSVWPPYPGAGLGYWARQSGFYSGRVSSKFGPVLQNLEIKSQNVDKNQTDVIVDKNLTTINVP